MFPLFPSLSDVKIALEIFEKAQKWLREVTGKHRAAEEKNAARILVEAGTLVATLRTLDNSFRAIVGELELFHTGWSTERREAVRKALNEFAQQELLLPQVAVSLKTLDQLATAKINPEHQQLVRDLVACAQRVRDSIGESRVTPFPSFDNLGRFLDAIYNAQTPKEERETRLQARAALKLIDRESLAKADQAFGSLRGLILKDYPNLPTPEWTGTIT